MSKSHPTIVIDVDVNGPAAFKYNGADEIGQAVVKSNGDINLESNTELKEHDIEFRLPAVGVKLDGALHDLEFAGPESISIEEEKSPRDDLLKELDGNPQFHGYANPDGDTRRLRVSNRNKGGEYKYTLRVKARARDSGAEQPLVHDPKIKNTGAN